MTRFEIKAVRWACGFNTDLRIDLKLPEAGRDHIVRFLDQNILGIFGTDIYDKVGVPVGTKIKPEVGEDWEQSYKPEAYLQRIANQVVEGRADS